MHLAFAWSPCRRAAQCGTGTEVPLQFDDQQYLDLLNERIRDEGTFPVRER